MNSLRDLPDSGTRAEIKGMFPYLERKCAFTSIMWHTQCHLALFLKLNTISIWAWITPCWGYPTKQDAELYQLDVSSIHLIERPNKKKLVNINNCALKKNFTTLKTTNVQYNHISCLFKSQASTKILKKVHRLIKKIFLINDLT